MSQYRIKLDLTPLLGAVAAIPETMAPRLRLGLGKIAERSMNVWQERVKQQPGIWRVEKNRYVGSLNWRFTGPLSVEVGTDYEIATLIEEGRPARDLKKMLNTSQKVRRTQDGRRFLVIPFRHNTPGSKALAPAMSEQAYGMAAGLSLTRTRREVSRPTGQVMMMNPKFGMRASPNQTPFASDIGTRGPLQVKQRVYDWGGKLTAKALREAGMDEADVKRYAGMVRVKDSAGKNRGNYLTFRVMMEGKSGWVIPAQPGRHIAQGVARDMEPIAQQILQAAAKGDAS